MLAGKVLKKYDERTSKGKLIKKYDVGQELTAID